MEALTEYLEHVGENVWAYLRSSWNPTPVASLTCSSVCEDQISLPKQVGIDLRPSSCHNLHDAGVTGVCHRSWLGLRLTDE